MKSNELGTRMKEYEGKTDQRLMPLLPVMARLDGRSFHTFTRGLERPYDERLNRLMVDTAKFLAEESNACIAYTQSDEISLAWYSDRTDSQIFFDGRLLKMSSVLASLASVFFNRELPLRIPDKAKLMPVFDCRVWTVPTLAEGANVFLWREQDATKNSISMAAQHYFSHKELQEKTCNEMQEMLFSRAGVNWNDYPSFFKRGVYVQRRTVERKFTTEELEKLPEKHEARKNPDLVVVRSHFEILDMPPFGTVTNREGVVFRGETPRVEKKQ